MKQKICSLNLIKFLLAMFSFFSISFFWFVFWGDFGNYHHTWEYIIKYNNSEVKSNFEKKGYNLKKIWFWSDMIKVSHNNKTIGEIKQEIKNIEDIEKFQPNFVYTKDQSTLEVQVDDREFERWNYEAINWEDAIDFYLKNKSSKKSKTVAVIDSWIDNHHKALKDQLWDWNCNGNREICNNFLNNGDKDWHWTHVSWIVGWDMNTDEWFSWINPEAEIMSIKWIERWRQKDSANVLEAIYFAIDNEVKIINASFSRWSIECDLTKDFDLLLYEAIKDFKKSWWLFVTSAWSEWQDIDNQIYSPASFGEDFECAGETYEGLDNIISVWAINSDFELADFSNYWKNTVDITAPWTDIYSTKPNNEYETNNWVSMATPHISWVVSLIWSYKPDLSSKEVKKILLSQWKKVEQIENKTKSWKIPDLYNSLLYLDDIKKITNFRWYKTENKETNLSSYDEISSDKIYFEWDNIDIDNSNFDKYKFIAENTANNKKYKETLKENEHTFEIPEAWKYDFSVNIETEEGISWKSNYIEDIEIDKQKLSLDDTESINIENEIAPDNMESNSLEQKEKVKNLKQKSLKIWDLARERSNFQARKLWYQGYSILTRILDNDNFKDSEIEKAKDYLIKSRRMLSSSGTENKTLSSLSLNSN